MPEPVIVALGRSPIGRAMKGSLVNIRPDDLAASVVMQVLDRLPELDRATIEDLICGCGLPGRRAGLQPRARDQHPERSGRARNDGHAVLLVIAADVTHGRTRDPRG